MIGVCSKCSRMFETSEEDACTPGTLCPDCHRKQYWTEREAAGDVDPRRCLHGVPLNVFCDRCES